MKKNGEFIELVAGCLDNVSESDITMETKLDNIDSIDSLATLALSAGINIKYGVNLSGVDILECDTIAEIYELVEKSNNG